MDEDRKRRHREADRAAKEAKRRADGVKTFAEYNAIRAARLDALTRRAEELGLSIPQIRRRIRTGKMLHPYDEGAAQ